MRAPGLVVYRKELRDAIRDRRTAIMIFIASVLMGPVTLVLVAQYVSGLEEKAKVLKVRLSGREHAPALVNFFQRNDVEIEEAPANYEARVREGQLDAVIVIPPDFDDRYLAGDGAKVEIVYDDSRTESGPATRQAERLLRAFSQETGMLRLVARGVSPDLVQPLKVEHVNTATPRQRGAILLFIIPMFAVLSPLLGGMTVAIDATAGERERGSLEPLLANPVAVEHVVIGKWLSSWTFATAVALLTLGGFFVAGTLYADRKLSALFHFGLPELALFALLVVPFAAMTSALQMLICTYGRSYREAQTYVSYLTTVASFVPIIVIFSGLRDATWQLAVPVLGQQMLFSRIVRGDAFGAQDWAVPTGVAIAIAAVALVVLTRLLRQERIVFGRS
jgi:sodium transport system permease protein